MRVNPWLFPNGKTAALTMSYDDGTVHDERLISIFNQYGIKGTFHIDGKDIKNRPDIYRNRAKALYQGHEVAVHTEDHPHLYNLTDSELLRQVMDNKETLEDIFGYTVRGMSYPFGDYDKRIERIVASCGIKYSRTVASTYGTGLPGDFLEWHPSCHHNRLEGMLDKITQDAAFSVQNRMPKVLYVWGHSYELYEDNSWDKLEAFCKQAAAYDHIWFATNIEIYDYAMASRSLEIAANCRSIYNPSGLSVWVELDGKAVEIKPGENKLPG